MALPEPVGVQVFRPAYGALAHALDSVCASLAPGTYTRLALTATATREEAQTDLGVACGLRAPYTIVRALAVRPRLVLRTLAGSRGFQ